jgi:hypothetical protein
MKQSKNILRELLDPLDVMWRAARVRHLSRWGRECRAKLARWSGTQQAKANRRLAKALAE